MRLYLVREVWYPLRIVSKHAHYSTERAYICWKRIVMEGAKSLLFWFDDAITHTVTKYVDRCPRFHRLGFIGGKTSPLNCFMELLHIFIMFLLVSPCYCNVVQIWEGVPAWVLPLRPSCPSLSGTRQLRWSHQKVYDRIGRVSHWLQNLCTSDHILLLASGVKHF